jgi:hypothetical protein
VGLLACTGCCAEGNGPSRHGPARPLDLGPLRKPLVTLLGWLPHTSREAWPRGTGLTDGFVMSLTCASGSFRCAS